MTNNDRLVRALMISSIVLASLLHSVPSMADCDSGGTAESGLHDSIITGTGAGGTGLQASEETGTGTGGTGFGGDDDSGTGTGGTGIFGVVTGFGSVCVNGHEVDYDARTLIRQDGKSATISDLAVGQTVRIQTSRTSTHVVSGSWINPSNFVGARSCSTARRESARASNGCDRAHFSRSADCAEPTASSRRLASINELRANAPL